MTTSGSGTRRVYSFCPGVLLISRQCVADVAEAIIGAAFQTAGPGLALKVVKSLHIPLPFIESWEDFSLKAKVPPPDITLALDDNELEMVEIIVGARFRHPHLLAQALVCILMKLIPWLKRCRLTIPFVETR